jgi:hypothetical protein
MDPWEKEMSARTQLTPKKKANFLKHLAKHGNVSAAALASGTRRASWYEHKAKDPEFSQAWDDAIEISTDLLILELRRRAYKGTRKPVFHQGIRCGSVREYSDSLGMFLVKAKRPEYRDNKTVDLNVHTHEASLDELE